MKGKLLIIFKSAHGYVKRYVDILGNALGCDAVPCDKLRGDMLRGYDRYLYIGSVRGKMINGFQKISEYLEAIYDKLIVCGVGLLPYSKELADGIKEGTVSVAYEKFVPMFYARGGFDMNELGRTEKMSVAMVVRQIRNASVLGENETAYLEAVKTPFDDVKKSNIQPLIDYLEEREVDEALYSPAEITDPEEIKAYFAEQEKTAAEPENKKRALKKKLLK